MRRRFGYLPEERGLYPKMRVGDQLRYLARLHELDRRAAAEQTRRWLHRLALGSREQDQLEALSLGNQQRVQLAAALVHRPVLLVADEPFSGLDPVGVQALSDVLREGAATIFKSRARRMGRWPGAARQLGASPGCCSRRPRGGRWLVSGPPHDGDSDSSGPAED